jgi:uncharacterized protein (UPF0332 family)
LKRRSEEYLGEADRFLAATRVLLEANLPENSAAEAYQATFSAAHAALSEVDREARTHHGTWTLFDQLLVRQDLFEGRSGTPLETPRSFVMTRTTAWAGRRRRRRSSCWPTRKSSSPRPGDVLLIPPRGAPSAEVEADQVAFDAVRSPLVGLQVHKKLS